MAASTFFVQRVFVFAIGCEKRQMVAVWFGGFVGGSSPQSNTAIARDVVDVNLNFGGGQYRLSGDREQVDGLVNSLKRLSRGR